MKSIFTSERSKNCSTARKSYSYSFSDGFKYLSRILLIPLLFFSVQIFGQGFGTIDFHQAQNDRGGAKVYLIDWVNGSLNSTHTDYWEGIGVPQRIVVTGIIPNAANSNVNKHSLRFQVLSSKGDKHAYDFPISWEQAFKTAEDIGGTVNELQNLFNMKCGAAFSSQALATCGLLTDGTNDNATKASFPDIIGNPGKPAIGAPNINDNITCFEAYKRFGESSARYGDRTIEIRGNSAISNVAVAFTGYQGSGKDYAEYLLTWVSASDQIMVRFATRLAPGNGWCGYGAGNGAGSISGAPYHVTLERFDDVDDPSDGAPEPGVSMGSQDNQIMSNAIQIPPPQCGLSAGSTGCAGSTAPFVVNYTSADAAGAVVKFYFISNTAGAKIGTITALGNCTTNTVSVTADGAGSASISVQPAATTGFTAGSFKLGACVTGPGGSTTCNQPNSTTISEASVVAKVNNTATSAAAPFVINANLSNPTATLTALASLNNTQDNTLFSSFAWTVASGVTGNIAVAGNVTDANTATATFSPTSKNPAPGYEPGLYAFDVTVTSLGSGCTSTARVYITVTSGANCPADITGPSVVCETTAGHVYSSPSLAAKAAATPPTFPEPGLTYTWSIVPADAATITSSSVNVTQVTVTANSVNFAVKVVVSNQNGETFSSSSCQFSVTVVAKPTVSAIYNPPGCSDKEFTVDVANPTIGYTYSISQPGNASNAKLVAPNTPQTPTAGNPTVHFTGLTAGDGFVVTVSNPNVAGSCTGTTDCASSTNSLTAPATAKLATTPDAVVENLVKEPAATTTAVASAKSVDAYKITLESTTTVKAAPNPFTDKIRFSLVSAVSGNGSLELYNTLGQRVGTVYSGFVQAGVELRKEYQVPTGNRSSLIYVFKVGCQQVTGKLVGLK